VDEGLGGGEVPFVSLLLSRVPDSVFRAAFYYSIRATEKGELKMESIEGKLGRLISEMSRAALKAYRNTCQGCETAECLCNIAESCIKEFPKETTDVRESGYKIRRNNGGTYVEESRESFAEADRILLEGIRAKRPQAFQVSEQATAEKARAAALTESQKKDYEFCKLLGMSEADALKVASSSAIAD
jgi:hypothetical protein